MLSKPADDQRSWNKWLMFHCSYKWLCQFQHQVGKTLGIYPRGDTTPPVEWGHGWGHPRRQLIRRHGSSTGIDAQVFSIWCQEPTRPFKWAVKHFQSFDNKSSRTIQTLLWSLISVCLCVWTRWLCFVATLCSRPSSMIPWPCRNRSPCALWICVWMLVHVCLHASSLCCSEQISAVMSSTLLSSMSIIQQRMMETLITLISLRSIHRRSF